MMSRFWLNGEIMNEENNGQNGRGTKSARTSGSTVYLLVEGKDKHQLQKEVQWRVNAGFEPIGGIAVETIDGGMGYRSQKVFHQALIRRSNDLT